MSKYISKNFVEVLVYPKMLSMLSDAYRMKHMAKKAGLETFTADLLIENIGGLLKVFEEQLEEDENESK